MTAGPRRVSRRRPGWPGAGFPGPPAHAGRGCRFPGCARGKAPARRRGAARGLAGGDRVLRGVVRPADGRAADLTVRRRCRIRLGCAGTTPGPGSGRRSASSITGPERRAAHVVDTAERAGAGYSPGLRACSATPTSRRRTSGGTAGRYRWCTTGTAWHGSRRRRWRSGERVFCQFRGPALAPIESSETFLLAYQQVRAPSRARSRRSHGGQRVDGGIQRPRGRAARRHLGPAMCSGDRQPNASAGLVPSTREQDQRTQPLRERQWSDSAPQRPRERPPAPQSVHTRQNGLPAGSA